MQERLHQPVAGDHRAQRRVAGGEALGAGDDVGLVAVALRAEHVAEAAERADDLVGDQQHVVLVADLADPLEVAGRRREAATGVLHRLEEHRGDGVGTLELDGLGDPVRRPSDRRPPRRAPPRPAPCSARPVEVGVRHPERRGHQRLERCLHARQTGDGQRALGGAVVGDGPTDDLVLGRLAGQLEVVLGQLPGALDRLAATTGEEDPVQVTRRVARDPLGQLDRRRVRVGPQRHEGQLAGLLGRGVGQLGTPVAQLGHEEPGQCVEVALALRVVDVGALASDDDGHV